MIPVGEDGLELLDLHLLHVDLLGELEGVEAAAGVDADVGGGGEALGGRGKSSSVSFRQSHRDDLDSHDGVERGQPASFRRQRRRGAREGVVLKARSGGAQRAGFVPRDTGGLLLRHDAGDGQHRPPAVNYFVLRGFGHGQHVIVAQRGRGVRVGGAGVGAGLLWGERGDSWSERVDSFFISGRSRVKERDARPTSRNR